MLKDRTDKALFIAMVGIIFILYAMIEWKFPIIYDDWGFLSIWNDYEGENSSFFSTFIDHYNNVRTHQNGRLSNAFAPLPCFSQLSNLIFAVLTGAAVVCMILLSLKFAALQNNNNRFLRLSVCWILFIILLPWRDSIFAADYALNYIFASAFSLIFIYLIVSTEQKQWTIRSLLLIGIYALPAGAWHEGFSATTLSGLGLYVIFRRFKVSWQFYVVLFLYALAFLFCFLAPAMLTRLSNVISAERDGYNLITYCELYLPLIALCLSYIIFFLFKKGRSIIRRSFKNPYIVIGTGVVVSGFIIFSLPTQPLRSTLWPGVFCIINMMALFSGLIVLIKKNKARKVMAICTASLISLICIAQCVITLYWVNIFRNESDYILENIPDKDNTVVFYDLIPRWDVPRAALKIPPMLQWHQFFGYYCLWLYKKYDFIAVVPTRLEYADLQKGENLMSNINARRVDDYILGPYRIREDEPQNIMPREVSVEVEGYNYPAEKIVVLEIPFITKPFRHSDGTLKSDTLMYYKFDQKVPAKKVRDLKVFNFLETLDY